MCLWFGKVFPSRYSFPAGGPSQWAQILRHADERGGGQEGAVSREPYFHQSIQPASQSLAIFSPSASASAHPPCVG